MIYGNTVGLAISGDPFRRPLCDALYRYYRRYDFLDEISLYYRKNPAVAFNEAASHMKSKVLVCAAGDLYVGESELRKFIEYEYNVVFAVSPLYPRRYSAVRYPWPWALFFGRPFVSGLFRTERVNLVLWPMPDSPSFCEDILWERAIRQTGKEIVGIHVPCVHVDHHLMFPRLRRLVWSVLAPERFRSGSKREAIVHALGMSVWEWKDAIDAIHDTRHPVDLHWTRLAV